MTIVQLSSVSTWHSKADSCDYAVSVKRSNWDVEPPQFEVLLERHIEILAFGGDLGAVHRRLTAEALHYWLKAIHQTLPF